MRKLITLTLFTLLVVSCDDMQVVDIMSDLSGAPDGMVLIPGGEVYIGLSQSQLDIHNAQYDVKTTLTDHTTPYKHLPAKALPYQKVYVDDFYMDKYEVTYREYFAFVEASGYESVRTVGIIEALSHKLDEFIDEPITQLTIAEMQAYAEWHDKQLPTEIEWEKAARGGLEDVNYPWGNEIDHTKANYNHEGILNVFVSRHSPPLISPFQPGQYEPNLYGLYDMAGNVAEYVVTEHDARGDNGLDQVISRGGDWRHIGFYCQNWHRVFYSTGWAWGWTGFRCVKRIE